MCYFMTVCRKRSQLPLLSENAAPALPLQTRHSRGSSQPYLPAVTAT
jgi:hypothetical protein